MIAVIDYGIGNVGSIINMLKKIGVPAIASNDISVIEAADKIILPGVGAFDTGMQKLNQSGLVEVIKDSAIKKNKPILGICLGMQMLGISSEEGQESGLSLIPFKTKKFNFNDNNKLKIPHMGWNIITPHNQDDPIFQGIENIQRFYFVHSYHAVCESEENILMKCDYGYSFAAAVKNNNVYGVQFHPEKSHKFGMALLENFARRV